MGALLTLDVGLSTGVALQHGHQIATDTVAADDLADYLSDVNETLRVQGIALDAVIAERPLMLWRSRLSRDLGALCTIIGLLYPDVQWIDAASWKQQQEQLIRYARSRHLVAWRLAKGPHEHDALLIALHHLGVLTPAKSP